MPENEQELLKLETEIYHSDGGIYFAECDTASTRDEIVRRLENRFLNKNIKIIKVEIGVGETASTRDEIAQHLESVSSSKDARRSEIGIRANDLAYTLNRYRGNDVVFFVYLPPEKPELEKLARILNYTREEFAQIKKPIIIWVDKVSLGVIARSAPDFWAWRARVSEFRSVSGGSGYGGEVEAAETIWRGKISDEEIQSYERALAEFQERGDEREAAKVLVQLGVLHYRSGKWDRAIEHYKKGMEIFEALGDRHGLAKTYGNLGLVYADKGEWDLAIEYYKKDLEISEALRDRHGLAKTYGNLGLVYADKGEWDLAIEYYEKSMGVKEALGDRHGLAQTYGNMGSVYARKGEWDLAIEYYEKDMEIFEALGDRHGLAQTYGNLGLVYARKGGWDIAIEYYEKSMKISEALGDRHGVGMTLANIGKLYLNRSDPASAKRNFEEAIENIHPDAHPHYPNALNWLAVSLRMVADQKKHEAKLAAYGADRKKLVSDAAELYHEASGRYKETHGLPFARMPHSLMMDAHLTRGLSYSVQNITEEDAGKAIELLDRAIAEMKAALKYSDGADTIRLEGAIASHKAKRCVREIDLHREDAKHPYPFGALTITKKIIMYFRKKERDRLLDVAISYFGEASESFASLGETDACSSKTCDGCGHLYTALGLIRDGYREKSNQKIKGAVHEIRLAEGCYQSISNELGVDVVDRVNEILKRVADDLNLGFDPSRAYRAANNVFDALDEIAGVGLRNMIKILVWDEAGNMTERKLSERSTTGGDSASAGGVIISGTIGDNAAINIKTGNESLPKKRKSVSQWDLILGAISGFSADAIAIILMHYYFEESVKSHPILLVTLFAITLLTTIFILHKISKS